MRLLSVFVLAAIFTIVGCGDPSKPARDAADRGNAARDRMLNIKSKLAHDYFIALPTEYYSYSEARIKTLDANEAETVRQLLTAFVDNANEYLNDAHVKGITLDANSFNFTSESSVNADQLRKVAEQRLTKLANDPDTSVSPRHFPGVRRHNKFEAKHHQNDGADSDLSESSLNQ